MAAASAKGNYGDGDVVAYSRVPFVGLVYYALKMRELQGVTSFMDLSLKHQLLLFDKLYVCGASSYISRFPEVPHAVDLAFLDSHGILKHAPPKFLGRWNSQCSKYCPCEKSQPYTNALSDHWLLNSRSGERDRR
jgi:hypothetical protein